MHGTPGLPMTTSMTLATSTADTLGERLADATHARRCPVYDWCEETGDHGDHYSADISAPGSSTLTAWLLHHNGSHPYIGLSGGGSSDLDATGARREAARIRAFADQLDAMADVLDGGAR